MRKKELYELNQKISVDFYQAKREAEELKRENEQLLAELKMIRETENSAEKTEDTSLEKIAPELDVISQYGAKVIGKTVVKAAQFCTKLTSAPADPNTKEMINLILGRTEVAKAQILNSVTADCEEENKKFLIDNEYTSALDYFESIMAQRK